MTSSLSSRFFLIRPSKTKGPPITQDESTPIAFVVGVLLYMFWRRVHRKY